MCAGSLAHSCVDPKVALVGASGGGYALIGAHFANIIRVLMSLVSLFAHAVYSVLI